jgi:hypothetical protein
MRKYFYEEDEEVVSLRNNIPLKGKSRRVWIQRLFFFSQGHYL